MKKYTIGLDLGTSSVKGVLFDGKNILRTAQGKFSRETVKAADGAEYIGFSADDFTDTVSGVIKELAQSVGGDVSALSIASASGNTVILDGEGKPLVWAYSWTNAPFSEESRAVYGDLSALSAAKVCGWQYFETFSLAHLAHIKIHSPEIFASCAKVGTATEYLLYKFTGKWCSDRSTITPFYLYDQVKKQYHEPYLKALGISKEKLPLVYESGEVLSTPEKSVASKLGIRPDTKIVSGSFDHPSAALASGVENEGDLLLSCGTSWVCFFPYRDRDRIIEEGLLCDSFLSDKTGCWGAMFSVSNISESIDKILAKYIGNENRTEKFNMYAEKAKSGAGGLKINPVTDCDKDFSAYSKDNIARAVMEGAADLLKTKIDEFEKKGISFGKIVMAGGPSNSMLWKEIIAEKLGKKIEVLFGVNSGAAGAAIRAYNAV